MKKFVKITSIILVLAVSMSLFAGCFEEKKAPAENTIGKEMPNLVAVKEINKDMSAQEMLVAAIENYYATEYVAKINIGKVDTTVVGMKVTQYVDAVQVREGSVDPTKSDAEDTATYYVDNRSASSFVKIWEETYISGNTVKFRKSDKNNIKFDKKTGDFSVGKYNAIQDYTNEGYAKYQEDMFNNPKKIWGYNITADTIAEASKVTKKGNVYTFTIKCNINMDDENNAIADYYKLMEYMLSSSVKVDGLTFENLELTFSIWENGFFKNFEIKENYFMNIASVIKSSIELNSFSELTYDKAEVEERIAKIKELA